MLPQHLKRERKKLWQELQEERFYLDYAGFWLRLAAFVWDTIIQIFIIAQSVLLIFLAMGFSLSALSTFSSQTELQALSQVMIMVIVIAPWLLVIFYYAIFEALSVRATPGKLLVGLFVGDGKGNKLPFIATLNRNMLKYLPSIVLSFVYSCVPKAMEIVKPTRKEEVGVIMTILAMATLAGLAYTIIDPLCVAFSINKQALHDKWAMAYVFQDPSISHTRRMVFASIAWAIFAMSIGLLIYAFHKYISIE